VLQVFRE